LITHVNVSPLAVKLWRIAGSPTLMTEPSMNARLDARMVVARMRRGCFAWSALARTRAGADSAMDRSHCE
jgi:hypothetical protein